MNTCLTKYFDGLEINRKEAANVLKNMLSGCTLDELQGLEKSPELPTCLRLLINALLRDMDSGQLDTALGIIDSTF